jgi:uncharacterized protein
MTETIITVQGSHTARIAAERATVHFGVSFDGGNRSAVFTSTTSTAENVRTLILPLHNVASGPVTEWSSESVRVSAARPWNDQGKQLPLVYHAAVDFTATFNDFDELARFIESSVELDGVAIAHLEWALTEEHSSAVTEEVRSKAVADAVTKASVYARAIGLERVVATAVADPGMLGEQTQSGGGVSMERKSMVFASMDAGGGAELSLTPRDIEVTAAVDARFVAS